MKNIKEIIVFSFIALATSVSASNFNTVKVSADVLNVRAADNIDSEIIGKSIKDSILYTVGESDDWLEVNLGKETGWASKDYLEVLSESVPANVTASALNMRETPDKDGNLLMKLHEGTALEILDKSGDWYQVEYNGVVGYVFEKYVSINEEEIIPSLSQIEEIAPVIEFANVTVSTLNMRETPDKDGNLLMKLHEGTALEILDKFGDWYEVEYNDVIGYVFEKYVSVNEDGVFSAKSPREGISAVIEFAKEKLGSEYVWGANGPNQFDCSGYVKYVFENAIGVELPRTSYLQSRLDNKLDFSELEKGDLVFFDTSKQGRVNHVGIYLGDGKFIHASSARSKKRVTISELSKFYKNTFKWGVRI